jgi:hypothetical protein
MTFPHFYQGAALVADFLPMREKGCSPHWHGTQFCSVANRTPPNLHETASWRPDC